MAAYPSHCVGALLQRHPSGSVALESRRSTPISATRLRPRSAYGRHNGVHGASSSKLPNATWTATVGVGAHRTVAMVQDTRPRRRTVGTRHINRERERRGVTQHGAHRRLRGGRSDMLGQRDDTGALWRGDNDELCSSDDDENADPLSMIDAPIRIPPCKVILAATIVDALQDGTAGIVWSSPVAAVHGYYVTVEVKPASNTFANKRNTILVHTIDTPLSLSANGRHARSNELTFQPSRQYAFAYHDHLTPTLIIHVSVHSGAVMARHASQEEVHAGHCKPSLLGRASISLTEYLVSPDERLRLPLELMYEGGGPAYVVLHKVSTFISPFNPPYSAQSTISGAKKGQDVTPISVCDGENPANICDDDNESELAWEEGILPKSLRAQLLVGNDNQMQGATLVGSERRYGEAAYTRPQALNGRPDDGVQFLSGEDLLDDYGRVSVSLKDQARDSRTGRNGNLDDLTGSEEPVTIEAEADFSTLHLQADLLNFNRANALRYQFSRYNQDWWMQVVLSTFDTVQNQFIYLTESDRIYACDINPDVKPRVRFSPPIQLRFRRGAREVVKFTIRTATGFMGSCVAGLQELMQFGFDSESQARLHARCRVERAAVRLHEEHEHLSAQEATDLGLVGVMDNAELHERASIHHSELFGGDNDENSHNGNAKCYRRASISSSLAYAVRVKRERGCNNDGTPVVQRAVCKICDSNGDVVTNGLSFALTRLWPISTKRCQRRDSQRSPAGASHMADDVAPASIGSVIGSVLTTVVPRGHGHRKERSIRARLRVACRNLLKMDINSESDPGVSMYVNDMYPQVDDADLNSGVRLRFVGSTETRHNDAHPQFRESLFLHAKATDQIVFQVFDSNPSNSKKRDIIGTARILAGQLLKRSQRNSSSRLPLVARNSERNERLQSFKSCLLLDVSHSHKREYRRAMRKKKQEKERLARHHHH